MDLREKLLQTLSGVRAAGIVARFVEDSKSLTVVIRSDGDVQVELHLDGQQGSPFEQLFVVPEGEEEVAAGKICAFVTAFLNEEIVLAVDGRLLHGGRSWLRPDQLDDVGGLVLSASWRGTFDELPGQR